MAPLAARRLEEMVELGARVVAIELVLAAQACDLRGATLGVGHGEAARRGAAVRPVPRGGRRRSRTSSRSWRRSAAGGSSADGRRRSTSTSTSGRRRSCEALRQRDSTPRSQGDDARAGGGDVPVRSRRITTGGPARAARPPGIDVAVVSLQPTLGLESLEAGERDELDRHLGGGDARARGVGRGRHRRSRRGRPRDGFAGPRSGAMRSPTSARSRPYPRRTARLGLPLRPPGGGVGPGRAHPLVGAGRRLHEPDAACVLRLARSGQERWPDVPVVFAILAGGAPIQLERLASRGVDVRPSRQRTRTSSSTRPPTGRARSGSAPTRSGSVSSSSAPTRRSSTRASPRVRCPPVGRSSNAWCGRRRPPLCLPDARDGA